MLIIASLLVVDGLLTRILRKRYFYRARFRIRIGVRVRVGGVNLFGSGFITCI